MQESAAQLQNPSPDIPANPLATGSSNSQENDTRLKEALEKFKRTGQVDQGVIAFAKEQILPGRGLSTEQINELGPVAVMVKLQEEPKTAASPETKLIEDKTEPAKTTELEKPVDLNGLSALSGNVEELTDNLSSQIDQEIKRQMAEKNALEKAQEKVNQSIKEHEEQTKPKIEPEPKPVTEVAKPKIGLFQKNETPQSTSRETDKIEHNIPTPKVQSANRLNPNIEESRSHEESPTDPLTASVNYAIKSLHEGDKIGEEWTLKKVLTTTFGNNKSPFYELVNKSGASWTLSPEEMKDVVRSNILSEHKTPETAVKEIKGSPLHQISFDHKETSKEQRLDKAAEKPQEHTVLPRSEGKIDVPSKPETEHNEKTIYQSKHRETTRAESHFESKHEEKEAQPKPKFEPKEIEKPKHEFESSKSTHVPISETVSPTTSETKLNQQQIEFINKIHADPILWRNFISFSTEQWTKVHQLYEAGKLIDIGIDAHPLIDRLTDQEFGEMIDIHKGDTANKLLEKAGYNLSWTADDAPIFGAHIIANHKLLEFGLKKLEISGISAEPLPSTKDIIDLVVSSQNGNHEATRKLQESLQIIPFNNKFKIVKPAQLDQLKKYFKN